MPRWPRSPAACVRTGVAELPRPRRLAPAPRSAPRAATRGQQLPAPGTAETRLPATSANQPARRRPVVLRPEPTASPGAACSTACRQCMRSHGVPTSPIPPSDSAGAPCFPAIHAPACLNFAASPSSTPRCEQSARTLAPRQLAVRDSLYLLAAGTAGAVAAALRADGAGARAAVAAGWPLGRSWSLLAAGVVWPGGPPALSRAVCAPGPGRQVVARRRRRRCRRISSATDAGGRDAGLRRVLRRARAGRRDADLAAAAGRR